MMTRELISLERFGTAEHIQGGVPEFSKCEETSA